MMKTFSWVAVLALVSMVLTACSSPEPATPEGQAPGADQAQAPDMQ
ncbi:MAG TPA: hypothetical protein PLS15_07945 [Fimbriimonadaceae bacterium]|nr:hypothetical protein [Fimbriimonadaceae bacterium]